MKRSAVLLLTLVCCVVCPVQADYTVQNEGTWPDTWPKELDGLRAQARTLEGPLVPLLHYAIPFANREEFEAAWPQLLKVKTEGTAITLRRGPSFWLDGQATGVCVHCPPADDGRDGEPGPITIELIVDGEIVDLNRIPLPPDTPIVDERFKQ